MFRCQGGDLFDIAAKLGEPGLDREQQVPALTSLSGRNRTEKGLVDHENTRVIRITIYSNELRFFVADGSCTSLASLLLQHFSISRPLPTA